MTRSVLVVVSVVAVLIPASAMGVWGGTVDTTHPQVGAMYYDFDGTGKPVIHDLICSGSFAGTSWDGKHDVFLTAGHCMPPPDSGILASELFVSFDSNTSSTDVFNDEVPGAIQVQAFHQMPGFGQNRGDLRDLAVLLLREGSVPDSIAPVQLAPLGYLDGLKAQRSLMFRTVHAVGYGVTPVWDSPGPTTFDFDGKRRTGTLVVNGLTKAYLQFNQNRNGIGSGSGLCFGDSGSPQLEPVGSTYRVVSVTSGGNGQCNAGNYNYRVDTPQARAFLEEFVELP